MAIYSNSLDALVEKCCRLLLHDWAEGTATGGDTATLADTSRPEASDYWNSKNAWIYIRSGTYAGAWKRVTDFVETTGVITFVPILAGNIVAGVTYSLHTEYTRAEVVEAINLAIDMVAEEALVWKIDETSVTLVADTYEYALPLDFMFINRVTMADASGYFYDPPINPTHYTIVPGATPKLKFHKQPSDFDFDDIYIGALFATSGFTASRLLRIEGMGSPATLANDSSTCPLSPAYVIYQAAALLHMSRTRGTAQDPDDHYKQGAACQTRADIERGKVVKARLPADSKRCRE